MHLIGHLVNFINIRLNHFAVSIKTNKKTITIKPKDKYYHIKKKLTK